MINYNNLKVLYMDDVYAYIDIYRNDIINYLQEYDVDPLPNNIEDAAINMIDNDFDDLITLVNTYDYKIKYDYILVVADLGLWYGRKKAVATFKSLKDAIQAGSYDVNIIYYKNSRESLLKESSHHDGINKYKYYKVVKGKKYAIKYNELVNIAI